MGGDDVNRSFASSRAERARKRVRVAHESWKGDRINSDFGTDYDTLHDELEGRFIYSASCLLG
jgi:hypothetical protein